jgi:hypothetical protein
MTPHTPPEGHNRTSINLIITKKKELENTKKHLDASLKTFAL